MNPARSAPKPCAFCRILQRELPGFAVYEDALAFAFLDHRPLLKGHVLLMPKAHNETLQDLPDDVVGPLFLAAKSLCGAVERATQADGSFLAINTRISQSVPHLHIHIVPRWKTDGLFSSKLVWKRQPYRDEAEMRDVQAAIRREVTAPET